MSPARHQVQPGAPAVRDIATSGTPIPPPPPRPERVASAAARPGPAARAAPGPAATGVPVRGNRGRRNRPPRTRLPEAS